MIDLQPASDRLARVLAAISDDDLGRPTPCPDMTIGDLVDHVGMFSKAFADVARKDTSGLAGEGAQPPADAANLEPGWRQRIADDLDALVAAWRDPAAWDGMTKAGGIDLPGEIAGLVALDELVVHGWDLAVATGQQYEVPSHEITAALSFISGFDAPRDGRLFGPVVDVGADASPFEQLLGLTGRDPNWNAAA